MMKKNPAISFVIVLFLFICFIHCKPRIKKDEQPVVNKAHINDTTGYLLSFNDTITDKCGYKNEKGEVVIQPGKYAACFTDTFRAYAIVVKRDSGFVAIDRREKILYKVYPYDNGPDYPVDGLFRFIANNKMGFAESASGKVVIPAQFNCAYPFEDGVAKVSVDCKIQSEGEHTAWLSDHWYYIDKTGKKVEQPKATGNDEN